MFFSFDNPDYWRHRAAQLVTHLSQVAEPAEREILLRLHEGYVRLASAAMTRSQPGQQQLPTVASVEALFSRQNARDKEAGLK
jgi:hypothetical protein